MNIIKSLKSLSLFEKILWICSLLSVTISFIFCAEKDYLSLIASVIGVTALIFVAKGDVLGQILTVIFSVFYGIISFSFNYYGEMVTYLGMTAPIALMSVISWLKNPFEKNKPQIKINKISVKEHIFAIFLALVVTVIFYFILSYFNTANIIFSTISVTTSFLASYYMFRRVALYAIAYAMNDIILIILWVMATIKNIAYLPMVICFSVFFINDMYGFINWQKIRKKQINYYINN